MKPPALVPISARLIVHNHDFMKGVSIIFSILLLSVLSVQQVFAQTSFVQPGDTELPPGGSKVAPPINTSATTQTKKGNLTLDGNGAVRLEVGSSGESSEICLNGDCTVDLSPDDYIRLQTNWAARTADSGFAEILAGSGQQYALKAEGSEPVGATPGNETSGLYGAVASAGGGFIERYGVRGSALYDDQFNYGVYGKADYDAAYAGYFEGRVRITGDLLVGSSTNQKKICLNDDGDGTGPECVTSWPFVPGQYVQLHTESMPAPDEGSLSITGSGTFSSIVLGTAPEGTPIDITCGDGVCQEVEDGICSVDCFTIPASGVNVQVYATSAEISWNTGSEPTTGELNYGSSTFYSDTVTDAAFANTHGPLTMSGLSGDTTYFYRLVSISQSGAVASYTNSFHTLPADASPPSQVNDLRVNGTVSWNTIPLAWDPATDNVAILRYVIERDTDGSGFVLLNNNVVGTSYTDTGLAERTTYTYRTYAVDTALNQGPVSNTLVVTTPAQPADTTPPTIPANLVLTGEAWYDSVPLQWDQSTDTGTGIKEYNVYRKLTSEPDTEWKFIVAVAAPTVTYTDVGPLQPNTSYDFAVSAVDNVSNESARSTTLSTLVQGDVTPPAAPAGIFTSNLTSTRIDVSWNKSTDTGGSGLAGYRLYRYDCTVDPHPDNDWNEWCVTDPAAPPGAGWTLLVQSTLWYFRDPSIIAGRQYQYRATAYDNAGNESTASPIKKVYVPYDACTNNNQCDVQNSSYKLCCSGRCASTCNVADPGKPPGGTPSCGDCGF